MPDASSFFCAIPHLEIHAEHMEFYALLPHSKSMWTSPEKGSARPWFRWKYFQTTHPLTLGPSTVKVKKASFHPCSLFRGQSSELRKSCLLFIGKIFVCWYQKENIELESSPIWMQGSILGAGNLISVSSSDNVLQAAKAAALFPSSFATGDVLLNQD